MIAWDVSLDGVVFESYERKWILRTVLPRSFTKFSIHARKVFESVVGDQEEDGIQT